MRSEEPKVLHRAAGRTLLSWVLQAVEAADPDRTMVVVGHRADQVEASLPDHHETVVQEPQNGTGHAVQVALRALGEIDPDDTIVVAYGDRHGKIREYFPRVLPRNHQRAIPQKRVPCSPNILCIRRVSQSFFLSLSRKVKQ